MGYVINPAWPTNQVSLEGKIIKKGDAPLEGPQWEKWTVPQFKGKPAVLTKAGEAPVPLAKKIEQIMPPAKPAPSKPIPPKPAASKPIPAKPAPSKPVASKPIPPKPAPKPAPKVEPPKVEPPKVEPPKAEVKKVEMPKVSVPKMEAKKEEPAKAVPASIPAKPVAQDERMQQIRGVGQVMLKRLDEAGYKTLENVVEANPEEMAKGTNRTVEKAKEIIAAAKELLGQPKKTD